MLDDERARLYATIVNKGCAVRFAFAAAVFGETSEALFWLQLPHALKHLMNKLVNKSPQKVPVSASMPEIDDTAMLNRIASKGKLVNGTEKRDLLVSHLTYYLSFNYILNPLCSSCLLFFLPLLIPSWVRCVNMSYL